MITHIMHTPMEEVCRKVDGDSRWCFSCRRQQPFEYVVTAPIVSCWCPIDSPRNEQGEGAVEFNTGAWYGPSTQIECCVCHLTDGDLFPGRYREWED